MAEKEKITTFLSLQRKNSLKDHTFFQPKLAINQPNDVYEQEADAVAEQVMRKESSSFFGETAVSFFKPAPITTIQRKCDNCEEEDKIQRQEATIGEESPEMTSSPAFESYVEGLNSGGSPLPNESKSFFESTMGYDFSEVRIHNDSKASDSANSINALAYTTGNNIVFNQNQFQPGSDEGKKLLAHELTHVVQQGSQVQPKTIQRVPAAAPAPLPTDLASYPASDKQRIQISTIPVPASAIPGLLAIFATNPATAGGARESFPANGTVVFSTNVPDALPSANFDLKRGLTSVAGKLENHTNILPLNNTVTITLDLTPYGGLNSNYRFSYFEHTTGTGAAATISNITLIELLGTTTALPTAANPTNAAPAGAFTVGGQSFTLASGWNEIENATLLQALNLLPAAALTQLTGATFARGAAAGNEAGSYDVDTHTITIRDNAFPASLNRYASGTEATRIILHEVGHALDYLPLRNAWTAYSSSGNATALTRTRSLSGSSYVADEDGVFQVTEGAASTDFRTAVIQDRTLRGVTLPDSVTTYGATNWEESFAEAFAFFMADRDLFKTLRPKTHAYFLTRYP